MESTRSSTRNRRRNSQMVLLSLARNMSLYLWTSSSDSATSWSRYCLRGQQRSGLNRGEDDDEAETSRVSPHIDFSSVGRRIQGGREGGRGGASSKRSEVRVCARGENMTEGKRASEH